MKKPVWQGKYKLYKERQYLTSFGNYLLPFAILIPVTLSPSFRNGSKPDAQIKFCILRKQMCQVEIQNHLYINIFILHTFSTPLGKKLLLFIQEKTLCRKGQKTLCRKGHTFSTPLEKICSSLFKRRPYVGRAISAIKVNKNAQNFSCLEKILKQTQWYIHIW